MYAPPIATMTTNMETLAEIHLKKVKETQRVERLKIVQAADSAAFFILDKFRRGKSDTQHRAFKAKLLQVSDSLGIHFSWLVEIIWHESRFNHKAVNSIGATGLIQFLPGTAKGLGTSPNALYNMSAVNQLDYVYKFYRHAKGKFKQLTDIHLYAFFPVALLNNWPDSKVIEYGKLSAGLLARSNPGLDTNKDGKITIREFRKEAVKHSPKEILALQHGLKGLTLNR